MQATSGPMSNAEDISIILSNEKLLDLKEAVNRWPKWSTKLTNRVDIFYGNSLDYYPSIGYKKSWFWALFAIFDFWALMGPKKWRGPTDTFMGLRTQNPTKNLTHSVDLLGHLLSWNCVSNYSDLWPVGSPP